MVYKKLPAFTIVELLVVIVVIGILAAITIVSYTGIAQKATTASLISDLDNASKLLKLDQITNMSYPATLAEADGGKGIPASTGTAYEYIVNNNAIPQGFCIAAIKDAIKYRVTETDKPIQGDCDNYGLVLSLDAGNPTSYSGSGTTWTDLSGLNNNGSLMNGITYTADDGGALVFDGIDDYVSFNNDDSLNIKNSITIMSDVYIDAGASIPGYIVAKNTSGVGDIQYGLHWNPPNTMVFILNGTTVGTSAGTLAAGQSYNLAVTWNKINVRFYVNGLLSGSPSAFSTSLDQTNYTVNIGRRKTNNYLFKGKIKQLRIYNRALEASEINKIVGM